MNRLNIGFISFRISGTNGVSLETKKWAHVLEEMGHRCYYMAGELDTPKDRSFVVEEAHFSTPAVKRLYFRCFDRETRDPLTTRDLHAQREVLKDKLRLFVSRYSLDLIIPQNTLTIPLNIPLEMAMTEFIAETGIPTIAHHHDFFWSASVSCETA